MKSTLLTCLLGTLGFALLGCSSSNRLVGNRMHQASEWYGELGMTGHLNQVTVRSGSRITKLSIIGDANKVFVEHGATLGKVEVWGSDNQISVPDDLVIRESRVGQRSVVMRRGPGEIPLGFEDLVQDSAAPSGGMRNGHDMRSARPMPERRPPAMQPEVRPADNDMSDRDDAGDAGEHRD